MRQFIPHFTSCRQIIKSSNYGQPPQSEHLSHMLQTCAVSSKTRGSSQVSLYGTPKLQSQNSGLQSADWKRPPSSLSLGHSKPWQTSLAGVVSTFRPWIPATAERRRRQARLSFIMLDYFLYKLLSFAADWERLPCTL